MWHPRCPSEVEIRPHYLVITQEKIPRELSWKILKILHSNTISDYLTIHLWVVVTVPCLTIWLLTFEWWLLYHVWLYDYSLLSGGHCTMPDCLTTHCWVVAAVPCLTVWLLTFEWWSLYHVWLFLWWTCCLFVIFVISFTFSWYLMPTVPSENTGNYKLQMIL